MKIICEVCPNHCLLEEGGVGFCQARKNESGQVISMNYGKLTGLALDPIEKKPLARYYPGSYILSIGSFGCKPDFENNVGPFDASAHREVKS